MWFGGFRVARRVGPRYHTQPKSDPVRSALATFIFIVSFSLLSFALMLQVIDARLKPTIAAYAEAKVRSAVTNAVNKAISEKVAKSIKYENLMSIKTDSRGKVALIQPNTGEINRLSSITVMEVQKYLKSLTYQRFDIPLGQILNSQLLASAGPRIKVAVMPIGSVSASVSDEFQQAGINQTRHRIYLSVNANVRIVVPLVRSSIQVSSKVPLTEAVIMGEVPQVYFGGANTK